MKPVPEEQFLATAWPLSVRNVKSEFNNSLTGTTLDCCLVTVVFLLRAAVQRGPKKSVKITYGLYFRQHYYPAHPIDFVPFVSSSTFVYVENVTSVVCVEGRAGDNIRYFWCCYKPVYCFATKANTVGGKGEIRSKTQKVCRSQDCPLELDGHKLGFASNRS